jgi:uncharacterized membrane protein
MGLVENKEEVITASQRSVMYLLRQRVHHYSKATTMALSLLIFELVLLISVIIYLSFVTVNMLLVISCFLLVILSAFTFLRLRVVSKHKRICENNLDSYHTR